MSSVQNVFRMARQHLLMETFKWSWGGCCYNLVSNVLMPFCSWPVAIKRLEADDFEEPDCVEDRLELDDWYLYDRSEIRYQEYKINGCVAVFKGFFNPLELCTHLAMALNINEQHSPTDDDNDNDNAVNNNRQSFLRPGDVTIALQVLRSIGFVHLDALHRDTVRVLLDHFVTTDDENAKYILVREDERRIIQALVGLLSSPNFTICHPEICPNQPNKKTKNNK